MPTSLQIVAVVVLAASGGHHRVTVSEPVSAELAEREVSIDTTLPTKLENGLSARAIVDVHAPPEVIWDTVLDFPARAKDSWMIDAVSIYKEDWKGSTLTRGARWELSVMGVKIVYHTLYTGDRKLGFVDWKLDASKNNDLAGGSGNYSVYALDQSPGESRLVYTFEAAATRSIGKGLRRRLTKSNVTKMMTQLRDTAEAKAE